VAPVDDQRPVEQFPAEGADPPFGDRVRLRRPNRRTDDTDRFGGEDRVKRGGDLGVPVADQVQQHRFDVGEVAGQDALCLGGQELPPALPSSPRSRVDAGPAQDQPGRRRRDPMAEPDQLAMDPPVTPAGILGAIRSTSCWTLGPVGGRPPRRGALQRRRTRSRCQRSTVSGATNSRGQWPRGTSRLSAACSARSAQHGRGRATCRRSTAS
jgi:hypothetical protein